MDLLKLEPIDFNESLNKAEGEAILTSRRRTVDALRAATGILAGLSSMTLLVSITMLSVFALAAEHPILAALVGLVGFVGSLCLFVPLMMRYAEPPDHLLLSHLFEPQAKRFTEANWNRRERLLAESRAFNDALGAFKALPLRVETDEVDAGVVANLVARRGALESEIAEYLDAFRAATADDRKRVVDIENARGMPKDLGKRRLAEFEKRTRQLARVEHALDGLTRSIDARITVDLSPFVAAQRLRSEIEAERDRLIADGLKPRKLPKPRAASRKLLSA